MKIEVTELLEIIGYAIGDRAAKELLSHYRKYQDWIRIKDLVLKEIIRRNKEHVDLLARHAALLRRIDSARQTDISCYLPNDKVVGDKPIAGKP
jgi:hypothetical protein